MKTVEESLGLLEKCIGSKKRSGQISGGEELQKRPCEISGVIPKRSLLRLDTQNPIVASIKSKLIETKGVVILSGINRTGKSTLAASVVKSWPGRTAEWTSAFQMLQDIKESFNTKQHWKPSRKSLLVIDEFDKFTGSEWAETVLDRTVCDRYDNLLPTLIVTNADKDHLKNLCTNALLSRIKESDGFVEMNKPWW